MNIEVTTTIPFNKHRFFKFSTLVILSGLVAVQVIDMIFAITIIPAAISATIAAVCILYLWLAEQKDVINLRQTNIRLRSTQDALRTGHMEMMLSLVLSQEAKDSYTYGHSERVKQYSIVIARELNLSEQDIEVVARGAKLHDIGKIGIKDKVMYSKKELTIEEYEIIKTHPVKGVAILEPLKFLDREKLIVRHHHERYDGTGYPDQLKNKQIPLIARIVCVADSFDAMRTMRPYKKALEKEEIIKELRDNSGTQFDPVVVEALIKHIDRFYVR